MTYQENYLSWLRDAHAMEKQAEEMLEKCPHVWNITRI